MEYLKKLQKGDWILNHRRYIDEYGFETDVFHLNHSIKRLAYPFRGFIKVNDKPLDFPINKIPYEYTEKDYEEMLDEQIKLRENTI